LDKLSPELRQRIWNNLKSDAHPWTLIIATHDVSILNDADKRIDLSHSKHSHH
jgi:ABC-type lipoprotein export system ATPase subunit